MTGNSKWRVLWSVGGKNKSLPNDIHFGLYIVGSKVYKLHVGFIEPHADDIVDHHHHHRHNAKALYCSWWCCWYRKGNLRLVNISSVQCANKMYMTNCARVHSPEIIGQVPKWTCVFSESNRGPSALYT